MGAWSFVSSTRMTAVPVLHKPKRWPAISLASISISYLSIFWKRRATNSMYIVYSYKQNNGGKNKGAKCSFPSNSQTLYCFLCCPSAQMFLMPLMQGVKNAWVCSSVSTRTLLWLVSTPVTLRWTTLNNVSTLTVYNLIQNLSRGLWIYYLPSSDKSSIHCCLELPLSCSKGKTKSCGQETTEMRSRNLYVFSLPSLTGLIKTLLAAKATTWVWMWAISQLAF